MTPSLAHECWGSNPSTQSADGMAGDVGLDAGPMPDLRISTALRQLHHLGPGVHGA